jgi:hypothetical protein
MVDGLHRIAHALHFGLQPCSQLFHSFDIGVLSDELGLVLLAECIFYLTQSLLAKPNVAGVGCQGAIVLGHLGLYTRYSVYADILWRSGIVMTVCVGQFDRRLALRGHCWHLK